MSCPGAQMPHILARNPVYSRAKELRFSIRGRRFSRFPRSGIDDDDRARRNEQILSPTKLRTASKIVLILKMMRDLVEDELPLSVLPVIRLSRVRRRTGEGRSPRLKGTFHLLL